MLTDYKKFDWIDLEVDALNTPFEDASVDAVVSSHMIHHLAKPVRFFREMRRILKPGGYLVISEVHNALITRAISRVMRHEGWSYDIDVFDENLIATDPNDPWAGNIAIPQLLFGDSRRFEEKVPGFKVVRNERCECFIFPLSGGVTAKARTVNLPRFCLRAVDLVDGVLTRIMPNVFAMGMRVVLEKV